MKKLLLIIALVFLLLGCEQEIQEKPYPKMAYRTFWLSRIEDGNMPLITKSDIPNFYLCKEIDRTVIDSDGNKVRLSLVISNGEQYKELNIEPNQRISRKNGPGDWDYEQISFIDVHMISIQLFCSDPELILNEEFDKEFSNFL